MWTNISNEGADISWVTKSMETGTAIWVTDGLFMKEVAPTISGAGWIMICTRTKLRLCGSFA